MRLGGRGSIEIKTEAQIQIMRRAGAVVGQTLAELAEAVRPGISTGDLDALARESLARRGATSSFLGYHGFPAVVCISVNDEVVHGIPGERTLLAGDLVSIDFGAIVEGWHGDAAVTVAVGEVSARAAALAAITEASMWAGLGMAGQGRRLSDVSHAIEESIRASGPYGIVEEYTGHGIGSAMHMHPPVPNHGRPGRGPTLEPGMALAIEPMAVLGAPVVRVLDDGWTVCTLDGSWAAHWEHTVAITPTGPWVLTAVDEVRLPDPGRSSG